jgi:hypothetical protein
VIFISAINNNISLSNCNFIQNQAIGGDGGAFIIKIYNTGKIKVDILNNKF